VSDRRLKPEIRDRWIVDMLAYRGPMDVAEIGHQLGLSVRHMQGVVRELRKAGAIEIAPGRRGLGRRGRLPTLYRVVEDRQSRYAQDRVAR
jgi:predicted ArsR family transcriptional regulator